MEIKTSFARLAWPSWQLHLNLEEKQQKSTWIKSRRECDASHTQRSADPAMIACVWLTFRILTLQSCEHKHVHTEVATSRKCINTCHHKPTHSWLFYTQDKHESDKLSVLELLLRHRSCRRLTELSSALFIHQVHYFWSDIIQTPQTYRNITRLRKIKNKNSICTLSILIY